MPSLDTIVLTTGRYGPFIAVAIATFLALEAVFLMIARRRRQIGADQQSIARAGWLTEIARRR